MTTVADLPDVGPIRIPTGAFTLDGFRDWWKSGGVPGGAKVSYVGSHLFVEILGSDWEAIEIPLSAGTLAGFRDWAHSEGFPTRGNISLIDGRIWIDMSPEEAQSHNKVKVVIAGVLSELAQDLELGEFYGDGMLVASDAAGLSTEPDGCFLSWAALESGRVKLVARKDHPEEFVEIVGSPDMVLEVVSRGSVGKDTKSLRESYYRAGVLEYWLVDALGEHVGLRILSGGAGQFEEAPTEDDWHRSRVFGRSFRLRRERNPRGFWRYKLDVGSDSPNAKS